MSDAAERTIEDITTLCTRCGICCSGALFTHVSLNDEEARKLSGLGIKVKLDTKANQTMALPCTKLVNNQCDIYADRPKVCRTYECKMVKKLTNGDIDLSEALNHVDNVQKMLRWIKGNNPAVRLNLATKHNPKNVMKLWSGETDQVSLTPNDRMLLKEAAPYFDEMHQKGLLSDNDKTFIKNVRDYLSCMSMHFQKMDLFDVYQRLYHLLEETSKSDVK